MKKRHKALFALILLPAAVAILFLVLFLTVNRNLTSPRYHHGRKWRLGYVQGGDFTTYSKSLKALVNGLARRGWLRPVDWSKLSEDATGRELWDYLCGHAKSNYLKFEKDAFWSADWNLRQRSANRKAILKRLSEEKDIDLMLAMGDWAGEDLSNNSHAVPTMVMAARDPVGSGIIRSYSDSGRDHIHAKCRPDHITRQIRMFHVLTNFKKLGVVYDPSLAGMRWSHLDKLRQAASENGFKLEEKPVRQFNRPRHETVRELTDAYRELSADVDAIWMTSILLDSPEYIPLIMEPLLRAGIPTWTPLDEEQVQRGVLFGVTSSPFQHEEFYGITASKIMNGIKPRELNQVLESKNELVINNAVAQKINFKFPPGIFFSTDKTYTSIKEGK